MADELATVVLGDGVAEVKPPDVSNSSGVSPAAATTPVLGNGVVEIILPEVKRKRKMPMDLPEGVGQLMMTESAGNIQASNRNTRGVFDAVMGALAGTVQSNFKDIGVLEGRSASGVFATPIAGPATK